MSKKLASLVLVAILVSIAVGSASAAPLAPKAPKAPVAYADGTMVVIVDAQGNKTLCKTGQAEGLFYPAGPDSPSNYASCDAKFPLRGLQVTIGGLPALCIGSEFVPMRPEAACPLPLSSPK